MGARRKSRLLKDWADALLVPRTVVVLSRRRASSGWERITRELTARYRPLPDTAERLGRGHMELEFPKRMNIWDARVRVAGLLDEIDPTWRNHVSMVLGSEPPPDGIPDALRPPHLRGRRLPKWRELLLAVRGR